MWKKKGKVVNWGAFDHGDKINDIPIEELVFKKKINVNYGIEDT